MRVTNVFSTFLKHSLTKECWNTLVMAPRYHMLDQGVLQNTLTMLDQGELQNTLTRLGQGVLQNTLTMLGQGVLQKHIK